MTPLCELSEAERAKRIGNFYHCPAENRWRGNVGGKSKYLGRTKGIAVAKWEALMLELGHGLAPGPNFFWNAIEQRWDKGESQRLGNLRLRKLKGRAKIRTKLIAEKKRLLSEIAVIKNRIDAECRARRATCDKLIREQWLAFEAKLAKMRVEYRAGLSVKELAIFDANRARIRTRVNRKRMLRVEALQRISRPWKDEESGLWFSLIGAEHRKLVRLGDDEQKARVVWWVLKNALNEGAKTLRKPECIQRTIDELLDISPELVAATLRQLGWWVVERPADSSSAREACPAI